MEIAGIGHEIEPLQQVPARAEHPLHLGLEEARRGVAPERQGAQARSLSAHLNEVAWIEWFRWLCDGIGRSDEIIGHVDLFQVRRHRRINQTMIPRHLHSLWQCSARTMWGALASGRAYPLGSATQVFTLLGSLARTADWAAIEDNERDRGRWAKSCHARDLRRRREITRGANTHHWRGFSNIATAIESP